MNPFEQKMVFLTFAGIGVAAITAAFFYVQLNEMQRQTQILAAQTESAAAGASLDEMTTRKQIAVAQLQAKAAQDSVAAIQQQMRQDQRAWVGIHGINLVTPLEKDKVFNILVIFMNSGKTPALETTGPIFTTLAGAPIKKLKDLPTKGLVYYPGTIFPGVAYSTTVSSPVKMTDDIIKEFNSGHIWIYVYGRTEYHDVFGRHHTTSNCIVSINGSPNFQACPAGTYPSYAK